jgi:phosphotransferase system HPr (HPr) family protein
VGGRAPATNRSAAAARSATAGSATAGSATAETLVAVPDGVDLHARPAAQFVRTALGFSSRVEVCAGEREADAKSLLSVLALGAKSGTLLRLRADGEDAPVAVEALGRCVAGLTE